MLRGNPDSQQPLSGPPTAIFIPEGFELRTNTVTSTIKISRHGRDSRVAALECGPRREPWEDATYRASPVGAKE